MTIRFKFQTHVFWGTEGRRKKWFIRLSDYIPESGEDKSRQAGTKAEITEEGCLLAGPYGFLSLLSYTPRDTS